jgi:hypothetical protein
MPITSLTLALESSLCGSIDAMKIVAVVNMETGTSGSLEGLARIKCELEPTFSAEEESAALASGVKLGVWPRFGIEDGTIQLNQPSSRWFLAGRSIESIECW